MKIIISLFVFSCIALAVHGNVPIHYYVTVAPLGLVILAYLVNKININKLIILCVVILINLNFYFSDKWLYKKGNYLDQKEIVKEIADLANNREFNLKRVGPFDYYDYNYAQNYRYLLWMLGSEPVDDNRDLIYTIYEEDNKIYFK